MMTGVLGNVSLVRRVKRCCTVGQVGDIGPDYSSISSCIFGKKVRGVQE